MTGRVLYINYNGKIIGKGRPRFGKGHAYTPLKTKRAESDLGWHAKEKMLEANFPLLEGPLKIRIILNIKRPKSWSKEKARNHCFVAGKPDVDNIQKLIFDALNKIVWKDDSQIAQVDFMRTYFTEDHATIIVSELE